MESISVLNIDLFQKGKNTSDFYFSTVQNHLVVGHRHLEKPHRHDFYATILFTKGSGVHEIDFQKYDVVPGSLFYMSPGQIHSWDLSSDIEGYFFFACRISMRCIMLIRSCEIFHFLVLSIFPENFSSTKKN